MNDRYDLKDKLENEPVFTKVTSKDMIVSGTTIYLKQAENQYHALAVVRDEDFRESDEDAKIAVTAARGLLEDGQDEIYL